MPCPVATPTAVAAGSGAHLQCGTHTRTQIEMILLSQRKLIHANIPGNKPMANETKKEHLLSQ